jgi:hypothetical protein
MITFNYRSTFYMFYGFKAEVQDLYTCYHKRKLVNIVQLRIQQVSKN